MALVKQRSFLQLSAWEADERYLLLTQKIFGVGSHFKSDPVAIMSTTSKVSKVEKELQSLNKWKTCISKVKNTAEIPPRMVYERNRKQAANKGIPSVLEYGRQVGLTDHETTTVFGWTTGDYRFVNPIARGQDTVEFWEYPWIPQDLTKVQFSLSREEVTPYVAVLKSALSKLMPDRQILWRGHRRKIPQTPGSRFFLEGFTSVTRDREKALEFCTKVTPETHEDDPLSLLAIVESYRGKCVSKFSARPEELEVLFSPTTHFEVLEAPRDRQQSDLDAVNEAAKQSETQKSLSIDVVYVKEVMP